MTSPDELKKAESLYFELHQCRNNHPAKCRSVNHIAQALRRQAVETLERPEITLLLKVTKNYRDHLRNMEYEFNQGIHGNPLGLALGKDVLEAEEAIELFTKLKSDLETKGENQK